MTNRTRIIRFKNIEKVNKRFVFSPAAVRVENRSGPDKSAYEGWTRESLRGRGRFVR